MSPKPTPKYNPKADAANRAAYIPPHVEAAMAKQMQQMMPAHMKKYVGPYMQQNVMNQGMAARPMQNAAPPTQYRPVTHLNREDHYVQYKGDHQENQTAAATPPEPDTFSPEQAYDFIINPETPQKRRVGLPTDASLPKRIAIIGGIVLVLLIAFVVFKNLLAGGSNLTAMVTVTQDQQAIIHLVSLPTSETPLSTSNQNFAATAKLSLSSAQSDLITYLAKNGQKVSQKEIIARVSKSNDSQLAAATAAATYNQTFTEVMKSKLNTYMADLKQAYNETTGPNGQALLKDDYKQANLLLIQLEDTKS